MKIIQFIKDVNNEQEKQMINDFLELVKEKKMG
jgi:hypothetical protein